MAQQGYHYHHYDSSFHKDSSYSPRAPVSPLLPSQRLLLRTSDRDVTDLNDLVSPIMSRSPSIASDSRFSALSGGTGTFTTNPADVRPSPAYVAPFGAAQVVSEYQASRRGLNGSDDDDDDLRPSKDDVSFSQPALALINAFLDQLLFSFLTSAKSTNLGALRPAVTDILKNKLARDAIASADTELRDLLAGGDDDDDSAPETDQKWDLELVWKRTRLRVMVYMRLGEMEDDDEERHVKEQELFANGERGRFSSTAGLVSWSAAIFLTSVLEHVAEQTLQVAGSAAFSRVARRGRMQEAIERDKAAVAPLEIDEQDVERIALNPSLGRLWRSWRKTMRANVRPSTPAPAVVPEVVAATPDKSVASARDSFGTAPESAHEGEEHEKSTTKADDLPDTQYPEHVLASNIKLPIGDPLRDVDEIEVPGLARDPSETGSDGSRTPVPSKPERRRSFSNFQSRQAELLKFTGPPIESPEEAGPAIPVLQRRRSNSVPMPYRSLESNSPEAGKKAGAKELGDGKKQAQGSTTGKDAAVNGEKPAEKSVIEDVDKRKSLIDIKALLGAVEVQKPQAVPEADEKAMSRPVSAASNKSFTLGDKEAGVVVPQQPVAERQHMGQDQGSDDPNQIGVATTSDKAVEPERAPSATGNVSRTEIGRNTPSPANGVRSTSNSPIPNLSRNHSGPRQKYSPDVVAEVKQAQSDRSEADGAKDIPSAQDVSQRDRPVAPSAQTLAALRESVQRASSPQAAQQLSRNDSSRTGQTATPQNRKSVAQFTGPVSAFSSKAQPDQIVEHPAVQRMKPQTVEAKKDPNITSASIRGPEDFDQFVQSDEVVKYTLTPEPIRDAPASNAQSLAQLTGQVPEVIASSTGNASTDRRSGRSLLGKTATSAGGDDEEAARKKRNRFSVTRPISRNTSVHRKSGLMARDARVVTESTRDFADFIRSTKPDKEPEIAPIASSKSTSSLQSNRNSTNYSLPRSQSVTGDRTRSLTRSDIAAGHAPPVPNLPGGGKSKPLMQAKPATGAGQQNGELISFIRDGPKQDGQHRISRTVAPFRSTMDSDQFENLRNGSNGAAKTDGVPARSQSSMSTPSSRPLVNGVSNAGNVAHPAYSGQPQTLNSAFSAVPTSAEAQQPEKKRYRNKDPYAIDMDDDDDIAVTALPRGRQHGESLSAFLRSTEGAADAKPIASESSLAQAREIRERARANIGSRQNSMYGAPTAETTALPTLESKPDKDIRPPTTGRNGNSDAAATRDLADFLRTFGPSPSAAPAPSVGRGVQQQNSAAQKEPPKKEKKSRGFFFFRRGSSKAKAGRHADMP